MSKKQNYKYPSFMNYNSFKLFHSIELNRFVWKSCSRFLLTYNSLAAGTGQTTHEHFKTNHYAKMKGWYNKPEVQNCGSQKLWQRNQGLKKCQGSWFYKLYTLASGTGGSSFFNAVAAVSYSGASLLQWPHLFRNRKVYIQNCVILAIVQAELIESNLAYILTMVRKILSA